MNARWPCRGIVLALGLALIFAPSARAQLGGGGAEAAPPRAESLVRAVAAPVSVVAGARAEVAVRVEIAAGWHINANPPSPDYMIPTTLTLTLTGAGGLTAGKVVYPAGQALKVSFEDKPLAVYSGEVTLRVPLLAARSAANGTQTLAGRVRFQTCNDQVCLAPTSVPFTLEVTVGGGGAGSTPGAAAGSPSAPAAAKPSPAAGAAESSTVAPAPPPSAAGRFTPGTRSAGGPVGSGSWLERWLEGVVSRGGVWWLIGLFLGGLALNLTPCVFPMLGVTVSVFGARRKQPVPKVLSHAVAYVIGIMITYTVLGVVAALTGGLFGSALQHPWVNVGLGVLFVLLALSMFGLYEMQPPPWLMMRLGGADATSLAGIFLSGLAVGIIAAPCVGPFVVGILAVIAQRGQVLFGLRTMLMLSFGLGFPYLFLALFSNLLQSLPRSGDWMLWVKKVFGVLLVSIGIFYVLVGLAPRVTDWVLPIALGLGGVYLGFVDRHGSAKAGFRRFKWALGALAVIGSVALVVGLQREGIRFQPYDEAAVNAALAGGRPVMIDFSADWCIPCHKLEHETFTDRRVIARSRDFAIFKADLTRYDSPWSQGLRRRFGVSGVPEILFFRPDGAEVREARVVGPLPAEPFLERMDFVASGRAAAVN